MTSPHTSPSIRRSSGFTLIEVAIALVIFVIGALAIVRIFPGALGVIQNSGDRLVAVNQNRAILAAYRNNPLRVPEGIYDAGGTWAAPWGTGSTVGSSSRNNALPRNLAGFDESALAHFKQVRGEKFKFDPATTYVKTNFPYAGVVEIYQEDTLENVRTDTDGNIDFSGSWRTSRGSSEPFSTDSRAPITPTDFRTNTTYYVTYRYVRNNRIWTITDEPITDAGPGAPQLSEGVATVDKVIAGSVAVRLRRLIGSYNTTTTPAPANETGTGYVSLAGATSSLYPGDTISLDYTVSDWRWIVHEATPDSDGNIVLPIKGVDDALDTVGFSTLWEGTATPTFASITNPIADPEVVKKLRKNRYPVGTSSFTAPQARVVYRTLDNWVQQTSVAARTYLPFNTAYASEVWRSYVLDKNILYFPASEAGKVITVSYTYNDVLTPPTDSSSDVQQERRVFTIEDDLIPKPAGLPAGFESSNFVSRVVLTDNTGNDLDFPNTAITAIRAVDGASIQVRSAWMDGDRFSQNSLMGYRRFE